MTSLARAAAIVLAGLFLAACSVGSGGMFSRQLDTRPGVVDNAAAARIISDYRRSRGLGPVTVNATLTKIAADQARKMAAANKMAHVLPGQESFSRRIAGGGYMAALAAENVGAGYQSLESAIQRWQASPGHDKNLLNPQVKEIGIAVAYASESRYKSYWALVLADPLPASAGTPRMIGDRLVVVQH